MEIKKIEVDGKEVTVEDLVAAYKAATGDQGKSFEFAERERQVRDAWRAEYQKPAAPGMEQPWYYVRVWDDMATVELPDGLYSYPYTIDDEGVIAFGEPVKGSMIFQADGEEKSWKTDGARYSQEIDDEAMIAFGGEIKALGDGRVGGYLVHFGTKDEKDLEGEWFTAKTYFGPADGDGADTLIHHGLPLPHDADDAETKAELNTLAIKILAPLKTKRDTLGIWGETILDMADKYEALIHTMVESGKLKWSSRSVTPLIRRKSSGEITRWPIVEGSLTPFPAEFRGTQVMPLKSYLAALSGTKGTEGGDAAGAACLEVAEARAKAALLLTQIYEDE